MAMQSGSHGLLGVAEGKRCLLAALDKPAERYLATHLNHLIARFCTPGRCWGRLWLRHG